MNIELLISYFDNHLTLTDEEKQAVRNTFFEKRVKRRQFILQQGDVSRLNTFVAEGCFRMYMIDDMEKNITFSLLLRTGGLEILPVFIVKNQVD